MRTISSLALSLLVFSAQAFSQQTAANTLKEIAAKVKAAKSPEPVVGYIEWNDFYKNMDKSALAELKVSSPAQLRDHFTRIFKDPGAYAADLVDEKLLEAPEEQRAALQETAKAMRAALDKKTAEMKEALGSTEFSIGKAEEKDGLAMLELISERGGEKNVDNVSMKKIGERWYLTSPNLGAAASGGGAPSTGAAPVQQGGGKEGGDTF